MWRSDEGVAPYGCLCQPKHTDKPQFKVPLKAKNTRSQKTSGISVFGDQYAIVVMSAYSGWETSSLEHWATMGRSDSTRMA